MIRLIIGGYAQGKLTYAKSLLAGQEFQLADEESGLIACQKPLVINHLHRICQKSMEDETGKALEGFVNRLYEIVDEAKKTGRELVIICDELGNGIVPMTREDRDYREGVGRLLCRIAAEADVVERIFCGLPQRIK